MSFVQGLSGLFAASKSLDVIGNNVANASTVGFKSSGTIFADVYNNSLGRGQATPGSGVAVATIQQNYLQGNVKTTNSPLDIAINGNGFFRLDNNGTLTYTRNGQFHLDKDGYVVSASGARVSGYGADAAGNIVTAGLGGIQLPTTPVAAQATAAASIGLNLDARASVITGTFDAADPTTYNKSTAMTVYDSLGNAHAFNTYYVKTAPNTWSVYGAMDGTALASTLGTLTFGTSGTLSTASPALPFNISATLAAGPATPMIFTLDYPGATQFGSDFAVSTLRQDGYASGELAGYSVGSDGTIQGSYTNGTTRNIGQIVLSSFTDPNGLIPLDGNVWAESAASGQPVTGTPGAGTLGSLRAGAVEESNVDLTAELVDMITAQRSYQASAQTIKTQDQVLNTLVNMR